MQQSRPPNQDQNLSYVGRAAAAVSQGLGITQSYHTEAANSSSPYISFKDKYDKGKWLFRHFNDRGVNVYCHFREKNSVPYLGN